MIKDVKISSYQLIGIMIGFLYGIVVNPTVGAKENAWIVFLAAWAVGYVLLSMYLAISKSNPGLNLIEILRSCFGKYIGNAIGLLYVWYFIHLAAIILRNFGEFDVAVIYAETPIIFLNICSMLVVIYAARSGIEVMGRSAEVVATIIPVTVILVFLFIYPAIDINNIFPILKDGIRPLLGSFLSTITFPFGELVVFLMIFPHLNDSKKLVKSSLIRLTIMGFILFIVTFRDLLVLGPNMFSRIVFPSAITAKLIPNLNVDPIIFLNQLIGGGIKITILLYCGSSALTQIFNLKNYKIFVIPLAIIIVALSEWLYKSSMETINWSINNYAYYAIPFQLIIPGILLVISLVKRKKVQS